jgi:hypothetical protein
MADEPPGKLPVASPDTINPIGPERNPVIGRDYRLRRRSRHSRHDLVGRDLIDRSHTIYDRRFLDVAAAVNRIGSHFHFRVPVALCKRACRGVVPVQRLNACVNALTSLYPSSHAI